MPTFQQLPSGKWRVQVRKSGLYRAGTFAKQSDAKKWATEIEAQANHIAAGGFSPVPKGATFGDLIDKYRETIATPGKTKAATLEMLKRELGRVKLSALSAVVIRDFIDQRIEAGAGGVTISADLSYLSAVLKWGRHSRRWDINDRLGLDARASLKYRGLKTRSVERDREPTEDELARLYEEWRTNKRQVIPMETLCRFALATGMRQGEICRLEVEDIDQVRKSVVIRDRKDPQNKVGNHQTVPLLPDAWAIVEDVLKERDTGFLFPFSEASVSTAFTRACQKLGIEDLRFHDLRHKATADFFRMGLDIPRVALLTGHKTWAMLRRYTAIQPEDVHNAIKKPASPAPDHAGQKAEPTGAGTPADS